VVLTRQRWHGPRQSKELGSLDKVFGMVVGQTAGLMYRSGVASRLEVKRWRESNHMWWTEDATTTTEGI
jgi:hypothetical protein